MKKTFLSSTWVVWALAHGGTVHRCHNCDARMFVRYESGLCPWCWNGSEPLDDPGPVTHVSAQNTLAGVLDDPTLEV